MNSPEPADHIIAQGHALVQVIDAFDTVEMHDPFERALAELFQAAYERRLMEVVEAAPSWVAEEILNTSKHIGNQWATLSVTRH